MAKVTLRFVEGSGLISELIELREGTSVPLYPSHVESVDPETGKYIGQHMDGGMLARDPGYDAGFRKELFVDLEVSQEQADAYHAALRASIGEPYDWKAILGYAIPGHFHTKFEAICSAKTYLLLRKISYFPSHMPGAVPAHCIDPRDLLFALSLIAPIQH
jgi:hypothetical protein